ncbi:MAG TPA: YiiD C-terminal domain-containing protein [Candidatus Didemnitutus sp.]|nr:YiiD C-terminal domain-containing protein [Candidatus Didemnitutus sp.]
MSNIVPESLQRQDLERFLHDKIPLTRAMELRVVESNGDRLVLEAPLAPNRNHLGTAFGGSLHNLPTLACYAVVWTLLREAGIDGHVVVKRSAASYREPVTGSLTATCPRPAAGRVAKFVSDLQRYHKARMDLHATIAGANGKPAVEYTGTFVAIA